MSDNNTSIREVQEKILEVMKYIDAVCRANNITYFIMGGTALGAIRHKGFIPWDDDLDIFMTPVEYAKLKDAMKKDANPNFITQEWRSVENYLEYAKVRMNGTTFIEEVFKDRKDMHHGIYVDIMLLHKVPANNSIVQRIVYIACKFVTLYALTQRNWKPKTRVQAAVVQLLKFLPCNLIANWCYKLIYRYDNLKDNFKWCYWITPAKFRAGLFEREFFENPIDIAFENTKLLASSHIKEYLQYRYGDYMKLPSIEQQKAAVHAMIFDVNKNYTQYIR